MKPDKCCVEIMTSLVKQGYFNQVTISQVEEAIICIRGPDPRTTENWKRALEALGYLEKTEAKCVYKVNLTKVPELLTLAVHQSIKNPQTKLL